MRLKRIDDAIERCGNHLKDSAAHGTPIESFLVQYLLILIAASFEEEIERLVDARVGLATDVEVQAFSRSCVDKMLRSIKVGELSGFLGRFSEDCKRAFQDRVNGSRAETFYGTLLTNRDAVAHSSGPQLTFQELVEEYNEAHVVLDAVRDALKVS